MRWIPLACVLMFAGAHANGPDWQVSRVAGVEVRSIGVSGSGAAALDRVLRSAVADLHALDSLELCRDPSVHVHPDLDSFLAATGAAWFQLAVADRDRCRIDVQRLAVLAQHGGPERTLRHELYHLAQPPGLSRWRAEGEAQRFAGEVPAVLPLPDVSPAALDALLSAPPDQAGYLRAMATALEWVLQGR